MSSIRAVPVPPAEWSDAQLDELIGIGTREAALLDELETAVASGNDELVLAIARRLIAVAQQLREP
jgi:hypothetical protein